MLGLVVTGVRTIFGKGSALLADTLTVRFVSLVVLFSAFFLVAIISFSLQMVRCRTLDRLKYPRTFSPPSRTLGSPHSLLSLTRLGLPFRPPRISPFPSSSYLPAFINARRNGGAFLKFTMN